MKKIQFVVFVIVTSLMVQFAIGQEKVLLTFGVYTSDKPTTVVKQFRPVLNVLQGVLTKSLAKPVQIKISVAKSYEIGIEDIVSGKVDFSRLGPASYVKAKERNPRLSILAMESKKGKKSFNGIICVRSDSSIGSIKELKGKSFAFGNEFSTIGRFLSQQYLMMNQISASDLSHFEYLGRHDKVGTAVGLRNFEGGALKEGTFKKLVAKGIPIRSIATFPNVTKPWVARKELPKKIQVALQEALLKPQDSETPKSLKKFGFMKGEDLEFDIIRNAMDKNLRFFEQASHKEETKTPKSRETNSPDQPVGLGMALD